MRGWLDPEGTAQARLRAGGERSSRHGAFAERALQLDMAEGDLFVAWELARLAKGLDEDELPALASVVLASLLARSRGSTRLPLPDPGVPREREPLDDLLAPLGVDDRLRATARALVREMQDPVPGRDARLAGLVGGVADHRPLVLDDGCLYHQRAWELERRLAYALATRLGTPGGDGADARRLVDDVEAAPPRTPDGSTVRLSDAQRDAVVAALDGRLTVISGEPGTGKTSIVVSILRALARRQDPPLDRVALAAPTGKAADRMRASVETALRRIERPALSDAALLRARPAPGTLHRLLGYSPRSGRFRHHERNPLAARFVIVDESSMIDLELADRLLRALSSDAQLVLLGDARQLPSVDAGAVFRDVLHCGGARARELQDSYRMDPRQPAGRHILQVARSIGNEEPRALWSGHEAIRVRARETEIAFEGVELIEPSGPRDRERVLACWYDRRIGALEGLDSWRARAWRLDGDRVHEDDVADLDRLLAHFERSRMLCVTRGRNRGVEAVNAWFHARAAEEVRAADMEGRGAELVPGEPVLVHRNDYHRNLFNGDTGVVVRVRHAGGGGGAHPPPPHLAAVFRRDDHLVSFPLDAVHGLLEPAWAVTVHKAQGSEHAHVAVLLPTVDTPLLTRELLYTAMTRASVSVLVIGTRAMLEVGVRRGFERSSGLAARVAQGG